MALAVLGTVVAAYLALFQLDVVGTVWEPFFGDGRRRILDSKVSHLLPVSDAALGAAGYLLDAVTGVLGGTDRWRRQPWLVILFGVAVGPLGAASIIRRSGRCLGSDPRSAAGQHRPRGATRTGPARDRTPGRRRGQRIVSGVALAAASPAGGRSRQTMAGGWRSLAGSHDGHQF